MALVWFLIILSFVLSFVAFFYPVLPGILFLIAGFVIYGIAYGFHSFSLIFISLEGFLLLSLFAVDYVSNLYAVKKRGGSKAAVWGSTIGLIIGPFLIPFIGIVIGPFLGAVLAEVLIHRTHIKKAFSIGVGSVIGFIGGTFLKTVIQLVMIIYFFIEVR